MGGGRGIEEVPAEGTCERRPRAPVRDSLRGAMERTRAALQPPDSMWSRWQRWLDDDSLRPSHVALVHGDLHPGHMLLAEDGRLTGILDWTEAQISDPSVDLAMFHGCFGTPALEGLLRRFEALGGRTWPRLADHAAERWAAFSVSAADWALRTGNQGVLEHALGHLASVAC